MSKTLILMASPIKGGNTDTLASLYKDAREGDVTKLDVASNSIAPCKGCGYCKDIAQGVCIQKDDMTAIYPLVRAAEEIAIFSPIYWWGLTAQAKLFIDRLYALTKEDWQGKSLKLVLNAASEVTDVEYELIRRQFEELCSYTGMVFRGFAAFDTSERDQIKKDAEAQKRIKELAKN